MKLSLKHDWELLGVQDLQDMSGKVQADLIKRWLYRWFEGTDEGDEPAFRRKLQGKADAFTRTRDIPPVLVFLYD